MAEWLESRACRRADVEVDVIGLTEAWLPATLPSGGGPTPHAVQDLAPWLAEADAFVLVTRETHDLPASLLAAVGWYREQWRTKPIAFVTTGGHSCGVQVVDHLHEVFVGLCATTISDTVRWEQDAPDYNESADTMLDQLTWWARALRDGRCATDPGLHPGT